VEDTYLRSQNSLREKQKKIQGGKCEEREEGAEKSWGERKICRQKRAELKIFSI